MFGFELFALILARGVLSQTSFPLDVGPRYPGSCSLSVISFIDSPHDSIRRLVKVRCSPYTEQPQSCLEVITQSDTAFYNESAYRNKETCPSYLIETINPQVESFLETLSIKRVLVSNVPTPNTPLQNTNVVIPLFFYFSLFHDSPFPVCYSTF
jgi:hypothetical protein